jgi:hypothetical protein
MERNTLFGDYVSFSPLLTCRVIVPSFRSVRDQLDVFLALVVRSIPTSADLPNPFVGRMISNAGERGNL